MHAIALDAARFRGPIERLGEANQALAIETCNLQTSLNFFGKRVELGSELSHTGRFHREEWYSES